MKATKNKDIIAILPMRKGSVRVKNKNMDDFTDLLQGYLVNKRMILKNELIHNVHRSINEN